MICCIFSTGLLSRPISCCNLALPVELEKSNRNIYVVIISAYRHPNKYSARIITKVFSSYHHKNYSALIITKHIQRFPPHNLLSAYHHKKTFSACMHIHVSVPSPMTKLLVNVAFPQLAYCPGKVLVIFKKSSCYHACSGFRHMQIYETATFCYEHFCCRNWLANC